MLVENHPHFPVLSDLCSVQRRAEFSIAAQMFPVRYFSLGPDSVLEAEMLLFHESLQVGSPAPARPGAARPGPLSRAISALFTSSRAGPGRVGRDPPELSVPRTLRRRPPLQIGMPVPPRETEWTYVRVAGVSV